MLNRDQMLELYERFVWKDVLGREARHCAGWGWCQSIEFSVGQLRIWSDPQPPLLHGGAHGIHVMSVMDGSCMLMRQYCDGRRADFTVAASLKQIGDILLLVGSKRIGAAADSLLERLENERKLSLVIGRA